MPENQWKVGDVVVLKSGGPPMTVTDVVPDQVITIWMNGGVVVRDSFPPAAVIDRKDAFRAKVEEALKASPNPEAWAWLIELLDR